MSSLISRVRPFLNYAIPGTAALTGLSRLDPRLRNFVTGATAAGYASNEIIDFLKNQIGVESSQPTRHERADEKAARARKKTEELPANVAKWIANLAAATAGGIGASRLAAQAAAQNLPTGGNPTGGNPAGGNPAGGNPAGGNPAGGNPAEPTGPRRRPPIIGGGQPPTPPDTPPPDTLTPGVASASANFILKHPDLGKYLDNLISKGTPPYQAAVQAKSVKKFQSTIEKIENDVGEDFAILVDNLFPQTESLKSASTGKTNNSNPTESELIAALQKIMKM